MSEQTKEKWELAEGLGRDNKTEMAICFTHYHLIKAKGTQEVSKEEDLANANLIVNAPETLQQRDDLLTAVEEIRKLLLKLVDDADSERMSHQNSTNEDFYLAEGKFAGIEKAESQIGKILNQAKSAIAAEGC
ncbi:MAG: hypothetical protein V3U75_04135 [Methylococcaceae bacterium]